MEITSIKPHDNAIIRFYKICTLFNANLNSRLTISSVWEAVVSDKDIPGEVVVHQILLLCDQAEKQILELNSHNTQDFLDSLYTIRSQIIRSGLDSSGYDSFKFREKHLLSLKLAGGSYKDYRKTRSLSNDQLESIKQGINALKEKVITSDTLHPELKGALITQFHEIIRTLDFYYIHGNEALKQALQNNLGVMLLNAERIQKVDEEDKEIFEENIKMTNTVLKLIDVAVNAATKLAPFVGLAKLSSGS